MGAALYLDSFYAAGVSGAEPLGVKALSQLCGCILAVHIGAPQDVRIFLSRIPVSAGQIFQKIG